MDFNISNEYRYTNDVISTCSIVNGPFRIIKIDHSAFEKRTDQELFIGEEMYSMIL